MKVTKMAVQAGGVALVLVLTVMLWAGKAQAQCDGLGEPLLSICEAYCGHNCDDDGSSRGCSTWLRRWHKLTGQSSVPCGPARCEPQTCGTFTPCDAAPCFCFELTEGGGLCIDDFSCDDATCDSSADCADGEVCTTNTCCGVNLCTLAVCTGGIQAPVSGNTAAGQ